MPRPNPETRTAIVREALELFRLKSYYAMSFDEIVEGTASKGSFYYHFKSKRDVAEAAIDMVQVLVPVMMHSYFAGRDWASGVSEWLRRPVGSDHAFGFAPVAVLGLQLGPNEQGFHHKAKWGIRASERSLIAELKQHGFAYEQASRRSATASALLQGYVMKLALTQDASCMPRFAADLSPLADDPDVPWPGRSGILAAGRQRRTASGSAKKGERPDSSPVSSGQ